MASAPALLTYARAFTPILRSVTPKQGSTAGGTTLTLKVEGLSPSVSASQLSVVAVGVPCSVVRVDALAGEVECITGSYGKTSSYAPGVGRVDITIEDVGTAASTEDAYYEYVDLWCRRTTWGGEGYTIP